VPTEKFIVPGQVIVECDTDSVALLLQRCFGRENHTITPGINRKYAIRELIEVPL
jgi:hypothetical protein